MMRPTPSTGEAGPAARDLDLRGLTLAERILAVRAGRRVRAGEIVVVPVDMTMMVDSIAPSVLDVLDELGAEAAAPERVAVVVDHVAPASSVEVATTQQRVRAGARRHGFRLFDVGRGICHQVLIEEGLTPAGSVVLGSDSHSTTYGAVGAFGTGMGATDIALAVASGRTWLKVPETVRVRLHGALAPGVGPKDLALEVVARLGADGATYDAIEYHGAEGFDLSGRMTLANLAVEAGAKVGLVPPSGAVAERFGAPAHVVVDPDATYRRTLEIDLTELRPVVAAPPAVDRVDAAERFRGVRVDQVFIGTCTNGRLEDLHAAAEVLDGRRVAEGTRLLVVPASSQVMEQAAADGTLQRLMKAGAVFGTPGCGPCMGRHMGVLAPGEVCVSTGNRNFVGRMGSPEARIFLAGPAVAAASAAAGVVARPEDLPVERSAA